MAAPRTASARETSTGAFGAGVEVSVGTPRESHATYDTIATMLRLQYAGGLPFMLYRKHSAMRSCSAMTRCARRFHCGNRAYAPIKLPAPGVAP